MTRAFARYAKHLASLMKVMLLAFASPAFAADEFSFSYLEAGYSIDSTIEAFGQSYDSDDSYRIHGSYQFNRHVFATAQYYSAGYDFEGNADFGFSGYSLGVGYKGRISSTDAMPVEWFAVLSYEHNQTHSQLHDVNTDDRPRRWRTQGWYSSGRVRQARVDGQRLPAVVRWQFPAAQWRPGRPVVRAGRGAPTARTTGA